MNDDTIDALGRAWTILREEEIEHQLSGWKTKRHPNSAALMDAIADAFKSLGYRYNPTFFGYWEQEED